MKYLILVLLFASCVRVKPVATVHADVKTFEVITDFCTGYAVLDPVSEKVIFRAEDIFCRDFETTSGQFLSEIEGGEMVIVEGVQYIIIPVDQALEHFERLGDEGVVDFVTEP